METINKDTVAKLQTYAKLNVLSQDVFKRLASRERAKNRSDIDAICREIEADKKSQLDYNKYIEVWRQLELMGVGSLVFGRRGNPNRFVWNHNLKEIGKQALNITEPKPVPEVVKSVRPQPVDTSRTVTFVLPPTVPMAEVNALLALAAGLVKARA